MPELPEAESIARGLRSALIGRTLGEVVVVRTDVIHGAPAPLERLLPGRHVLDVSRRAKRVVLRLGNRDRDGADRRPVRLVFRLGMSGRITVADRNEPVESHTHVRIAIGDSGRELRFRDPRRFGGVWFVDDESPADGGGDLGPEPLTMTRRAFRELMSRRRRIKALLMDQSAIAGLGNIYVDESLHLAGIHPETVAATLAEADADRLLKAIKSTLRRAIRHNGTTLMDYRSPDGSEGSFQRLHRVYQREGQPCRTCGSKIVRIITAGRSTFFCPRCQRKARSARRGSRSSCRSV